MCPVEQRCRYFAMKLCPCAVGTSGQRRIGGIQKGFKRDQGTCQRRRIRYWLAEAERLSPERGKALWQAGPR